MIEKIAYGSGDFANNLIFMTIMNFLLFFYTDVFGISAMVAGTLFLVARVEDALDDFITGVFVDHTHSRWGKLRPYLLFGSIPLGITAILCFTTPALNASGKIVYAYVTYIALMLMYSMVGIPYSAMTAAMTQDRQERVSLSSIRMIFAVIGGLIASVLTSDIDDRARRRQSCNRIPVDNGYICRNRHCSIYVHLCEDKGKSNG